MRRARIRGSKVLTAQLGITVPIIPGIMPIQTYASFLRMTKLCATRVPPKIMHDLVPLRVRAIYRTW